MSLFQDDFTLEDEEAHIEQDLTQLVDIQKTGAKNTEPIAAENPALSLILLPATIFRLATLFASVKVVSCTLAPVNQVA
jgi:hypothetical protein